MGRKPKLKESKEQSNLDPKLHKALQDLSKKFGKDIVHLAKDEKVRDHVSFAIPLLDKLTGGGVQEGAFTVLYGAKSVAKTTIAYKTIAKAQKENKQCAYFAIEPGFDPIWAEKFGVQLDKLLIFRPKTAEQTMDILIKLSKEKVINLAIIDSIHGMSPKGEQETKKGKEKSTADDTMALLARKLALFFRRSASGVYEGNVGILLIGQVRTDLGGFIKFDKLSGGNALAQWSSLTLRAYRGAKANAPRYKFKVKDKKGKSKQKEIIIGFELCFKLEKTKISRTAPENTEIRLPFYYGFGFKEPTDIQIKKLYADWIMFESEEE